MRKIEIHRAAPRVDAPGQNADDGYEAAQSRPQAHGAHAAAPTDEVEARMAPAAGKKRRAKSDPAPSRWSYRLQRMMLTPAYRKAVKIGLPVLVLVALTGGYFASQERRDEVMAVFSDMRNRFETRPEFMLGMMAIDGASDGVAEDIREVVPIDFPTSSFDLDLVEIQKTVTGLAAVAEAAVRIRPGGVLHVEVREREPVVVWRSYEGIALLDGNGVTVGTLDRRAARPDLPMIAGDGAENQVREALTLIGAAGPLGGRLRGLVRMGERRWDVVLDGGVRILLPESGAVQALERVLALDSAQDMLNRDLAAVDMRLPHRPTLRMNGGAVEEWWRIQEITAQTQDLNR